MHTRQVRHRKFDGLRHSRKFLSWLGTQAAKIGITAKQVFDTLLVGQGLSAEQVEGLPAGTAPAVTSVTITGTAKVGVVLTATAVVTGSPVPTKTYSWLIAAAQVGTASTYTPVVGDVGKTITCKVTATNSKGSANATSAATAAVVA